MDNFSFLSSTEFVFGVGRENEAVQKAERELDSPY